MITRLRTWYGERLARRRMRQFARAYREMLRLVAVLEASRPARRRLRKALHVKADNGTD